MNALKIISVIVLCFFSSLVNAGSARDMLDKFLVNTERMQARFQQKLLDSQGFLLQQSAGNFMLKRPGKFMWDYSVPYPQKIVSNGTAIWIYDSELEQVSIKSYDQVLTGAPVMLLEQGKNLDTDFRVIDDGIVDNLYQVTLVPRTQDSEFKQIRISLQNDILRSMQLLDAFEQTTVIEFEHLQVNPPLDDQLFEFVPPPGTDVVGEG